MDEAILKIYHRVYNASETAVGTISMYVDINYMNWLLWVLYPLLVTFLLPFLVFILLYASAMFLHVYRLRHFLREAYKGDVWAWARKFIAAVWDAQGTIWHGMLLLQIFYVLNCRHMQPF